MRYTLLIFSMAFLCWNCKSSKISSGKVKLNEITFLPTILEESSGLIVDKKGQYISHNDKGGANELYYFDASGQLLNTLKVSNAQNKDWEDLSSDNAGNIYISDTGNNDNDRENLRIYKLAATNLQNGTKEVLASEIPFSFPDQNTFPPSSTKDWHFDTEALFFFNDSLWLFTKSRSEPFTGITNLYSLAIKSTEQEAFFHGTFVTADTKKTGAITSAAISPDLQKMVLLSRERLWIFTEFQNSDFFSGKVEEHTLSTETQLEAVFFKDSCTLYLTDEKDDSKGGKLYEANICQ